MSESTSPSGSFSPWSIASLLLLGFAGGLVLVATWVGMHSSGAGPAEGAAVLFAVATCLIAAWSGTLLGTIFGWIGVRRSSSGKRFARAIAIVNTTVALLPAVPVLLWLIALLCSLVGLTR